MYSKTAGRAGFEKNEGGESGPCFKAWLEIAHQNRQSLGLTIAL
jgi:hypothetical protein